MSELPSAPPPPEEPTPGIQPQYTVPTSATNRWLGQRAPLYGIAVGMVLYVLGYVVSIILTYNEADEYAASITAMASTTFSSVIATVLVLIATVVLITMPRTRAFGAGLAISMAIGVLCTGGVCVALIFGTSGG